MASNPQFGPFGTYFILEISYGVNLTLVRAEIPIFEDPMDCESSFGGKNCEFSTDFMVGRCYPFWLPRLCEFYLFFCGFQGYGAEFQHTTGPPIHSILLPFFLALAGLCTIMGFNLTHFFRRIILEDKVEGVDGENPQHESFWEFFGCNWVHFGYLGPPSTKALVNIF